MKEKWRGAPPKPSGTDLKGQLAADAEEIHEVEEKDLPKKIDTQRTQTVGSIVAGLADEAMSVIGIPFDDEDMRRRFHTIVESYFNDLRDGIETRSKLILAKPSGGMGMTDGQADRVMGTLTVKQAEFEAAMRERLQTEKKAFVAQRAEKQLTERDDFEREEKTDLDRRYAKLTGTELPVLSGVEGPPEAKPAAPPKIIPVVQEPKKPVAAGLAPAQGSVAAGLAPAQGSVAAGLAPAQGSVAAGLAPAPKPQASVQPSPNLQASSLQPPAPTKDSFDGFFKEAEKPVSPSPQPSPAGGRGSTGEGINPVAPKPLASAPRTSRSASVQGRPSVPPAPAPVATKPVESVTRTSPPAPVSGKFVVSDVKSAPTRLTGPVEEIRSISVRDFRHLSKIPTEATLRIKDKIDLLEEQSFPQKTAGIAAWRESPTNKLYLDILRQSLEGIPVADIIGKMEAEGKETLTKAEFDSIMGLNRMLRFG